jgi:sigma-B regulation protein RsbU (phosphoserine phosphatase)
MTDGIPPEGLNKAPWPVRLDFFVETMRAMSSETDPQKMVRYYGARMKEFFTRDGLISLSRRELSFPYYRITRSHTWKSDVNPWQQKTKLPLFDRGIMGEWIYGEKALIINDLQIPDGDPGLEFLQGMRSVMVVPQFDNGHTLNMVVILKKKVNGFDPELLPEQVWIANLFGRATHNLVLKDQLQQAYNIVDRELKVVGDIQRSLLPQNLPELKALDLAVDYRTSARAGGDYYDFFALPDGRIGILIADVAGHGTPAAVLMAVTHSIAHTLSREPDPPSELLRFVNHHLCARYTTNGAFVTAFYGIYEPQTRKLTYCRAGHCPPRVRCVRDGRIIALDQAVSLPLGIDPDEPFEDFEQQLDEGDILVFYTDGIIEARNLKNDLFGTERLDDAIARGGDSVESIVRSTMLSVEEFTDNSAPSDDETLLVAKVM